MNPFQDYKKGVLEEVLLSIKDFCGECPLHDDNSTCCRCYLHDWKDGRRKYK